MAEARYRGQKVVTVSPDYADNTKFADEWLNRIPAPTAPRHGDGSRDAQGVLRRSPGAALRRVREEVLGHALPHHVEGEGRCVRPGQVPDRLRPGDDSEGRLFKTVLIDGDSMAGPWCPTVARLPLREAGQGSVEPRPRGASTRRFPVRRRGSQNVQVHLPDSMSVSRTARAAVVQRGVPVVPVETVGGQRLVTTVRPMLAQYGVGRAACRVIGPGLRRPGALHPGVAGGDHRRAGLDGPRIGRSCAERRGVRRPFDDHPGAGTNHWFHSDTIYRTFLAMITMTGCQGVNGGGWAHYVGPGEGATDHRLGESGLRPGLAEARRQMIGTAFWYVSAPTSGATTTWAR